MGNRQNQRIAVVEDDPDIAELLGLHLTKAGFVVDLFGRGDSALAAFGKRPPDLVLLDLMLPGLDGLELFRLLRNDARTRSVPVIMLTARAEQTDRIVGLELGADDYVTKPFSPREVVLRVKAVLRRSPQPAMEAGQPQVLDFGALRIVPDEHRIDLAGRPVSLTATEFRLLSFLAGRAGRVQSRDRLLAEVWGYSEGVDSRTVDTHVRRLRRKLGSEAERIETVIGVGYRFRS
ncbi:MAG: response regulator transcription factor [Acidobacteriota bacterium]|nr:MAG: response regulator transcription factor [Acidobacteriota bacterium]